MGGARSASGSLRAQLANLPSRPPECTRNTLFLYGRDCFCVLALGAAVRAAARDTYRHTYIDR